MLFERGKAWPPGQFPRSPRGVVGNMWDPSAGLHGMFDIWSFKGIEAVVSSGLGGGSLIYANVLLRKDERWFVDEERVPAAGSVGPSATTISSPTTSGSRRCWIPTSIPTTLPRPSPSPAPPRLSSSTRCAPHWRSRSRRQARRPQPGASLGSDQHPRHPSPDLPPVRRVRHRLQLRRQEHDRSHLPVGAIGPPARRRAHAVRGAWSSSPRRAVAIWFASCDHDGRGRRSTDRHGCSPTRDAPRRSTRVGRRDVGKHLPAALRNRSAFPQLSTRLGTRFNGNGDLLGFVSRAPGVLDPTDGPVITSRIRVPDRVDGGTGLGFYVEDGGYPELLSWAVSTQPTLARLTRIFRFAATSCGPG